MPSPHKQRNSKLLEGSCSPLSAHLITMETPGLSTQGLRLSVFCWVLLGYLILKRQGLARGIPGRIQDSNSGPASATI